MVLISQDGLKAIDASAIKFLVVLPDKNQRGNFSLVAKTPICTENFYDYLILFEHEDLNVVKHVLRFLASDKIFIPHDAEDTNIIVVDLPDLYRHGMKKIEAA